MRIDRQIWIKDLSNKFLFFLESAVEKASNMIKDFVNGEINSALQQSSTGISI